MAILVVDDDRVIRRSIELMCKNEGYTLKFASNGREGLDILEENRNEIELVLSDFIMPLMDGEELLTEVKTRTPHIPVVVMTSYGSIEDAVKFLKLGAADYITKPFHKEVLLHRIKAVLGTSRLAAELDLLRKELAPRKELDEIIGQSPALMDILKKLPSIANTEASVVVYGESGTGKELVARAIHRLSQRNAAPFVTINCGALPDNLLESELFGYRKGAFTGATRDYKGLAGEADTGTLFLDEIGEVSMRFQVKLLRFLQEKEYRSLGSSKTLTSDVRFISATHRNLLQGMEQGTFREDLYYRLNMIPIILPSLRERREDIPILANHFLRMYSAQMGKEELSFSTAAMEVMLDYPWPGNIRELKNKIIQVVVMSDHENIKPEQLGLKSLKDEPFDAHTLHGQQLGRFKDEKAKVVGQFEKRYITQMLRRHNGNIARASRSSGMDRKNFWQKMQRYEINSDI